MHTKKGIELKKKWRFNVKRKINFVIIFNKKNISYL